MKKNLLLLLLCVSSFFAYSQEKHFFLKIIAKNDAGWLQLREFSGDGRSDPINPITEVRSQLDFGYQPLAGDPKYQLIHLLKNNEENFIKCRVGLFRDGRGPSRGGWYVRFKIVSISDPDNAEIDVTPEYDVRALTYADDGEILFVIDPTDSLGNIFKTNEQRYKDFLQDRERR